MNILLVDDDQNSRTVIAKFLRQIGHNVTECKTPQIALEKFSEHEYPMVLSDIRMPNMSGIELLKIIAATPQKYPSDVVLFTGYADADSAEVALRAGAFDYLLKPINAEELVSVIQKIEKRQNLLRQNEDTFVTEDKTSSVSFENSVINCNGLNIGVYSNAMHKQIMLALKYHEDRSMPVLIEGPTGTGKEIIARLIHYGIDDSEAKKRPFVDINCATLSPTLFESELFGHEPNSFTGSSKTGQKGKLDAANGGTLFLDELEALPLDLQSKLLRVIQEKEFYRVGGLQKIKVDIRIICATNVSLTEKVKTGEFRSDLYYRLKVGHVSLPPLNQQKEAILPLATMFMKEFSLQKRKHFKRISDKAADMLTQYSWDGNIRELRNVIEWVVFMYDDVEIKAEYLYDVISPKKPILNRNEPTNNVLCIELKPEGIDMKDVKLQLILKALELHDGNRSAAARYLGISRRSIIEYLKDQ